MAVDIQHAILFTGHMIDAAGRAQPRFPARAEAAARAAIHNSLNNLTESCSGLTIGIAGGASGGDILFHEVCFDLAIPTRVYLAWPPDEYLRTSVAAAGESWTERFHALIARLGPAVRVLDDSVIVPGSFSRGEHLNVWARTNLWMASEAISLAPRRSLLTLWDGKSGDGPGGTADLISAAPSLGIDVLPSIATQALLQAEDLL